MQRDRMPAAVMRAAAALLLGLSVTVLAAPLNGPPLYQMAAACQSHGVLVTPGLVTWRPPCGWVYTAWWSWAFGAALAAVAMAMSRRKR